MTPDHARALRQIAGAIITTVKETGPAGAPGSAIYAALQAQGCTLQQYDQIIAGLVRAGKLRRDGHTYHWVADL